MAQAQKLAYKAKKYVDKVVELIMEFVALAQEDPMVAIKEKPQTAVLILSLVLVPFTLLALFLGSAMGNTTADLSAKSDKIDEKEKKTKTVEKVKSAEEPKEKKKASPAKKE